MYPSSSHWCNSIQQISYPCPNVSYRYSDSTDRLEKIRVKPYRPAKQTSKPISLQTSILPVPDLNDVDALLPKPPFSTGAYFDPDPRFQLFEQNSSYDKLPGSYVNEPLGSFYSTALTTEVDHTLHKAWQFDPLALSGRSAREMPSVSAPAAGYGLNREAIPWIRNLDLSRMQAQLKEKEADDVAARQCLLYEPYAELHDNSCPVFNDAMALNEELDDFYDPPTGNANPENVYDHRHYLNGSQNFLSPSVKPRPHGGSHMSKGRKGPVNNTTHSSPPAWRGWLGGMPTLDSTASPPKQSNLRVGHQSGKGTKNAVDNILRSSLPARRGWLGGMPAPVSTTSLSKQSSLEVDHDLAAASLPTPVTGKIIRPESSNEPTIAQDSFMNSSSSTGFGSATENHNSLGSKIPADLTPGATQLDAVYSPPGGAVPFTLANHQANASPSRPTFKPKLVPFRKPNWSEKRLALVGDSGETDWEGRQEGPYDFIDFCSTSLESDRSSPSDDSDLTADVGDPNDDAHIDTPEFDLMGTEVVTSPEHLNGNRAIPSEDSKLTTEAGGANDDALANMPVSGLMGTDDLVTGSNGLEDIDDYGSAVPEITGDVVDAIADLLEVHTSTPSGESLSPTPSSEEPHTEAASDDIIERTSPSLNEDGLSENSAAAGTPAQATSLAQDLEQSIHYAISQTARLTRELSQTSPIPVSEPSCVVTRSLSPSISGQLRADATPERNTSQGSDAQSIVNPIQSEKIYHEAHRPNPYLTPVLRRLQDIQSASLAKPNVTNLTPEYNSDGEDDDKTSTTSRGGLSPSLPSSPPRKSLDGLNLPIHQLSETSSSTSEAAYDSISIASNNADAETHEPEDLALTPTHEDSNYNYSSLSDPLEEVSLVEEYRSIPFQNEQLSNDPLFAKSTYQYSYTPSTAPAYSPFLQAHGPAPGPHNTTPTRAPAPPLRTPQNKPSPPTHLRPASQAFPATQAPTLTLPPTTPRTPTPGPKASQQHRPKKLFGQYLTHKNTTKERKIPKSTKAVFASKAIGTKSPSPHPGFGGKFIVETGAGTTISPTKSARASTSASVAKRVGTRSSLAELVRSEMGGTTSESETATAVVVPRKRKQKVTTGEQNTTDEQNGEMAKERTAKRPRRSKRTSGGDAAKMT